MGCRALLVDLAHRFASFCCVADGFVEKLKASSDNFEMHCRTFAEYGRLCSMAFHLGILVHYGVPTQSADREIQWPMIDALKRRLMVCGRN